MKIRSGSLLGSFTREGLNNLVLMALAIFYMVQFSADLIWKNACGQLASDYCSYWSAAKIANEQGYANVYNLKKMEEVQRTLIPQWAGASDVFAVVPTPYLPVFLIPFQILYYLGLMHGYWLWTIINLIVFIFYLRFFLKSMTNRQLSPQLILMILLCLPVFLNILYGQVNILLMICVGEHMRAAMAGKPFRAGLWLGGLLIKPQFLIIICLALLVQRSIKTILGLTTSSFIIIGISFLLAGIEGLWKLTALWIGYVDGIPTNSPELMMNWRMVGLNLIPYIGSASWVIVYIGMAITFFAALFLWRYPIDPYSSSYALALLGTLAATGSLAWHSHISSAMVLIPPIIYLTQTQECLSMRILASWVYIPPLFRFIVFILAILIQIQYLSGDLYDLLNLLFAISVFGLNLFLLTWSITKIRKPNLVSEQNLVTNPSY